MPKRYVYADIVWSWIWLLAFPIGIILIIWVNKWFGISVIVLGLLLPRAMKKSASQFVLEYATENEDFFKFVAKERIITAETVDSNEKS